MDTNSMDTNTGKTATPEMKTKICRAVLSVSDKTGLVAFAKGLASLGVELLSTGGTAKALREAGLTVIEVSTYTGAPELFEGRLKTLHPKVHGGILQRRDSDEHFLQAQDNNIPTIDLVVVNLYPFEETIAKPDVTKDDAIENIDIGGPAMLRSAAKNHASVTVVVDSSDYEEVLREMNNNGGCTPLWLREKLANKVFARTSRYDGAITTYLTGGEFQFIAGNKVCEFKGENGPQSPAVLYSTGTKDPLALENFELIEGLSPSGNNFCDYDRLLQTLPHIAAAFKLNYGEVPLIAVGGKHGNACGAAISSHSTTSVLANAIWGNNLSIFGGVMIANFPIGDHEAVAIVTAMLDEKPRLDGVIAPVFIGNAAQALSRTTGKCRVMVNPALTRKASALLDVRPRFRYVRGGFIIQPNYTYLLDFSDPELRTYGKLTVEQEKDLLLAWAVCSTSNSNTITIVKDGMLIGNGVGQQDRVEAAELAVKRAIGAGHGRKKSYWDYFKLEKPKPLEGAVACSDSFFPFTDGVQVLIDAGIKVIFSTTGSQNDQKIRDLCADNGVTLVQLPDSKARGFYGH